MPIWGKNIPEKGNNRYNVSKTGMSLTHSEAKKGPVYQTATVMIMLGNRLSPKPNIRLNGLAHKTADQVGLLYF